MTFVEKVTNYRGEEVGEIRLNSSCEMYYYTERNTNKNQIYCHKTVFLSEDSKEWYEGENCVAISVDICKKLLAKEVVYVLFEIKNFPEKGMNGFRKINLKDFLTKGITIKEKNYDRQRIIAMKELEAIKQ